MVQGRMDYSSAIRDIAPPNLKQIKQTVSLPKAARVRLSWMDFYAAHGRNAALTCRHYGIARSCFFKWKKRYDTFGPRALTDISKRPRNVRQSLIPIEVINAVKTLRHANPEFSKYKLRVILNKDYGYCLSSSSIGRIISRYNLFFDSPIKPKRHPMRYKHFKTRKPYGLKATAPGQLIEVDVKHLPLLGAKRYGFCAIDTYTKQATIHVASTISSAQAAIAWSKTISKLGVPMAVLSDNGSENMGAFADLVANQDTTHYFARPYTPKDKPHVERFIGTIERECIQWGGYATDLEDQRSIMDNWLNKYHSYRPHQALGYLTPDEYLAKLNT